MEGCDSQFGTALTVPEDCGTVSSSRENLFAVSRKRGFLDVATVFN